MKYILLTLLFVSMSFSARKWTNGFEMWGNNTNPGSKLLMGFPAPDGWTYGGFGGVASIQGTGLTRGAVGQCAQFNSGSTIDFASYRNYVRRDSLNISGACYVRAWIYVSTLNLPGSAPANMVTLVSQSGANSVALYLLQNGKLGLNVDGTMVDTSNSAMTNNQWRVVQIYTNWLTSGATTTIAIDGDTLRHYSGALGGAADKIFYLYVGWATAGVTNGLGSSLTMHADDIAVNDSLGSYENSAPDDSAFVFYIPAASDTARGGWNGGAGGTTSLYDAVNNLPQLGDSIAETNSTNVYDTTNSASDNLDVSVSSYNTFGVPAGKTLRLVQAVARHGEDVSAGTKAGAVKLVSNPADAGEVTFTYGQDRANRHAKDSYGGNVDVTLYWYTSYGDPVYAPSVNRSDRPVVRVGKRTATTAKVCVDMMGLQGEYGSAFAGSSGWKRIIKQ